MSQYRKATPVEQLDAWKHLAFELNLHRTITMDNGSVKACLARIDTWVNAHATGNGERPEKEVQQNVNAAFWENICKNPSAGLKSKVK
jgi:hypothetical protein